MERFTNFATLKELELMWKKKKEKMFIISTIFTVLNN